MSYGVVSLGEVKEQLGQAGVNAETAAGAQGQVADVMQVAGNAIVQITDAASEALGGASLLLQRLEEAGRGQQGVHRKAHKAARIGSSAVEGSEDEETRRPVIGLVNEDEATAMHRDRIRQLAGMMGGIIRSLTSAVKVLEEEAVPLVTNVMEGTEESRTKEGGYAKLVTERSVSL